VRPGRYQQRPSACEGPARGRAGSGARACDAALLH
jgi:hypothetical protein